MNKINVEHKEQWKSNCIKVSRLKFEVQLNQLHKQLINWFNEGQLSIKKFKCSSIKSSSNNRHWSRLYNNETMDMSINSKNDTYKFKFKLIVFEFKCTLCNIMGKNFNWMNFQWSTMWLLFIYSPTLFSIPKPLNEFIMLTCLNANKNETSALMR